MGCWFKGKLELTKLEEAIGTGRLMTQCPELDFKSCGYFANILIKLEIKSPQSRMLVFVRAVWPGEAACRETWGAPLWVTCSRLSPSASAVE